MKYPDAAIQTIIMGGTGIPAGIFADGILIGAGFGWAWGTDDYSPGDITIGVTDGIVELWK